MKPSRNFKFCFSFSVDRKYKMSLQSREISATESLYIFQWSSYQKSFFKVHFSTLKHSYWRQLNNCEWVKWKIKGTFVIQRRFRFSRRKTISNIVKIVKNKLQSFNPEGLNEWTRKTLRKLHKRQEIEKSETNSQNDSHRIVSESIRLEFLILSLSSASLQVLRFHHRRNFFNDDRKLFERMNEIAFGSVHSRWMLTKISATTNHWQFKFVDNRKLRKY